MKSLHWHHHDSTPLKANEHELTDRCVGSEEFGGRSASTTTSRTEDKQKENRGKNIFTSNCHSCSELESFEIKANSSQSEGAPSASN